MKANSTRLFLLLVVLLLLVVFWWTRRGSSIDANQASAVESLRTKSSGSNFSASDGEASGPARRPKRPLLEKKPEQAGVAGGLDERLDKDGPDVLSSEVHTLLPAGHSMVTGGFLMADGRHGFAVVTPKWVDGPNGGNRMIEVKAGMLALDDKALAATGLSSLATNEMKLKQNAEVWTPEDVYQLLKTREGIHIVSSPTITANPGQEAIISIDSGSTGLRLKLETGEGKDGGFDLKSDLKLAE